MITCLEQIIAVLGIASRSESSILVEGGSGWILFFFFNTTGDLSSPTRDRTQAPCSERTVLTTG